MTIRIDGHAFDVQSDHDIRVVDMLMTRKRELLVERPQTRSGQAALATAIAEVNQEIAAVQKSSRVL